MCHSIEMYMPAITRSAAEEALKAERAAVAHRRGLARGVRAFARQLGAVLAAAGRGSRRARWPALAALLLLAACARPAPDPGPSAAAYSRPAPAIEGNDTNVYSFSHQGPNSLGTIAVTARPTAGPGAAPHGTLAGPGGEAKAEAAAAFYAQNALCDGAAFRLASGETSQYDATANSWTVFGRCA